MICALVDRCLLLVEGKSADLAKFAIHSIPKQRILVTFTKSQPRNSIGGSNWSPPPTHNHHHNRHNGPVQTIFKAPSPPLAAPMPPFQGGVIPVGTSWPLPTQPRVPIPGTGVFLPPQEQIVQGNSGEGKLEMKTREEACTAAKEGDGNSGEQIN